MKEFCREHKGAYEIAHPENGREIDAMSKEELYHRVYHDTITGHYNWNYMWSKLDRRHIPAEFEYCFVHFDIKDFGMINEVYGHDNGNDLLKLVCEQMSKETDWVYHSVRCDNDNFAMMTKAMPREALLEKLQMFFDRISILPCDESFRVYYRCGVVTAEDSLSKNDRVADWAKFAQRLGKKRDCTEIHFYTGEMYEKMKQGKYYLTYLDQAIKNDEFLVYLQPKYDIHTETIVGAEALVRWNYKHEKLIFPGEFIPVFEENSVIGKVDQVVLEKTCKLLRDMKEEGLPLYPVSVNLSRRRMENKHLLEQLVGCVDKYGISHDLIEFELTESAVYEGEEEMFHLLRELRNLGFKISMDDFGTGYSSLSLLLNMPLDTLKIDKCFVDCIDADHEEKKECKLIKAIISMAKDLSLCCLAEGVEKKEQVEYLRKIDCDKIQGYYYSKPLPGEEYVRMIRESK